MDKKKRWYVDNESFLKALAEHKKNIRKAKREGLPKPQIPSYIGECFWKIAEGFSHSHKYLRYSYRDEMVSDGVENCLQYYENFDPKISKNPFGYFTQIIYYAFLRRIAKEHKQQYVKYKSISNSGVYDQMINESTDDDISSKVSGMSNDIYDNISIFVENYENNIEKKKLKKKAKK
jgi:hypothetical protein